MTNFQRREHKLGNQVRKLVLQRFNKKGNPNAAVGGYSIQNGRFTEQAQKIVGAALTNS